MVGSAAALTGAVLLMLGPAPAQAATIDARSHGDEFGPAGGGHGCGLREAIEAARIDADFGGCVSAGDFGPSDRIALRHGRYFLVDQDDGPGVTTALEITSGVSIVHHGPGIAQIETANDDRVLHVDSPDPVSLKSVEIIGGSSAGDGGAVLHEGSGPLSLENVTISEPKQAATGAQSPTSAPSKPAT